jgi:dGTPase
MSVSPPNHRAECVRIVRSQAFRSLAGKTQVVPLPRGDVVRTRITHVLEVTALAREIANALELDEALAEAIALSHDLGHPPFGHVGEKALAHASGNFHHAAHGVRVVEVLEPLALSPEVRAGILLHSKGKGPVLAPRSHAQIDNATHEACAVRVADLIAYASHDTEDGLALGYVAESNLPDDVQALVRQVGGSAEASLPERIRHAFSSDVIRASRDREGITMSEHGERALSALRAHLFEHYYERPEQLAYVPTIRAIVTSVFEAALRNGSAREAVDRVAALTDRAALDAYNGRERVSYFTMAVSPSLLPNLSGDISAGSSNR